MSYPVWPRSFMPIFTQPIDVDEIWNFQALLHPETNQPILQLDFYDGTCLVLYYRTVALLEADRQSIFNRLK